MCILFRLTAVSGLFYQNGECTPKYASPSLNELSAVFH